MVQENGITVEALAATLVEYDVPYLRTATAADPLPLDAPSFIAALAQNPAPRVRESLIPLFLRHPEFASYVPELADTLSPTASMTLRHMYTAAMYLQHLWRGQLEMYLGPLPTLPDYFGQSEWNLPAPTVHYGEAGLRVLAARFKAETGYSWLGVYEAAMALFLSQLHLAADD